MELFLQKKDIMDVHTKSNNVPCTLSPIIMKVQNYPKWKETTIGDIPFFTSMILGGRVWLCDIFSMIQFYYKLQQEKSVEVSSVRPRDPESCGSILRPSCSHPRMFLIQNEDEEGHMRRGKTFKPSQNETIHAMVTWNNSQHGSYNLVSFKPLEFCIPEKALLHRTSKILLLKRPSHLYDCAAFPVEQRTNSLKSNRPFWFTFVGAIGSRHFQKLIESTENSDIDSSNR